MLDVGGGRKMMMMMMMTEQTEDRRTRGRGRDRRNGGQQLNCGQLVVNWGRSRETGRWTTVPCIYIYVHKRVSSQTVDHVHTYPWGEGLHGPGTGSRGAGGRILFFLLFSFSSSFPVPWRTGGAGGWKEGRRDGRKEGSKQAARSCAITSHLKCGCCMYRCFSAPAQHVTRHWQ